MRWGNREKQMAISVLLNIPSLYATLPSCRNVDDLEHLSSSCARIWISVSFSLALVKSSSSSVKLDREAPNLPTQNNGSIYKNCAAWQFQKNHIKILLACAFCTFFLYLFLYPATWDRYECWSSSSYVRLWEWGPHQRNEREENWKKLESLMTQRNQHTNLRQTSCWLLL